MRRYGSYNEPSKEDLEREVRDLREQAEERERCERVDREQRRKEQKEEQEEALRTANSWPEALHKQITLAGREINWERSNPIEGEPSVDPYFLNLKNGSMRAIEIWNVVETENQDRINALKKQIKEIENGIAIEVAQRLETENKDYKQVARSLRNDTPENFINW
jgi:hypothetical protein